MRALMLAAALTLGAGVPVAAQTQAERLAELMSRDFAEQSARALSVGNRPEAIVQALRGFPSEPSEAEVARYADAYEALLQAMVSRAIRAPVKVEVYAVFDPTGRRVATISPFPMTQNAAEIEPLKLWDTQTGSLVAAPLPIEATTDNGSGASPPVFSPDGALMVIVARKTGELLTYDAATGALLRRVQAYQPNETSLGVVFSPDGRVFVTTGGNGDRIDLWETATGTRIATHRSGGLGCLLIPAAGGLGSDIHVLEGGYAGTCPGRQLLHRITPDGQMTTILDLASLGPLFVQYPSELSPDGTKILLMTETFGAIVIGLDGRVLANLSPAASGGELMRFARNGTALVAPQEHSGSFLGGVLVFDFDGTPLERTPEDGLIFTHGVYSDTGAQLGWVPDWGAPPYDGSDLPRGKALYDFVWDNVPQTVRDQVAADRVIRP